MTQLNNHLIVTIIIAFIAGSFVVVSCNFSKKGLDCSQLKNGDFVYHFRGLNYQTDFLISRNDSIQTEVDKQSGKTSKLSIRWTSECDYELKLIETTFDFPDSIQRLRKTVPTKTKIISQTTNYYIFKTDRDNDDFILTDTLWLNH